MTIGLSKSSLDTFKDCPKCFWLEKIKKLKRPQGIKASIMDGIDDGMKRVSDYACANKKPVAYLQEFPLAHPFPDRKRLEKFMSWQTFQAMVQAGKHQVLIWGQLDDLIEWEDKRVSPWDFKSNGKSRDWQDYTQTYNLLQADMYEILLQAQGLITTGEAYFTYTWPVVMDGILGFEFKTVMVETDFNRALQTIEAAVDCPNGPMPDHSPMCEYCTFIHQRKGT